jgi:crossover junction endodeoxyribonuclease RuvC
MQTPVGIDLSLTSTGFSCGDDQRVIKSKAKGPQRLFEISQEIVSHLIELDDPLVVLEGYSYGSRNSQSHSIGELGGVVRLALWNMRVPYVEIAPTVRAKFATGKGNAGKNEVVSAVSARTGIVWSGAGADDLCDAWVLEEIGLFRLGRPRHSWPATHSSVLDKVDWSNWFDE